MAVTLTPEDFAPFATIPADKLAAMIDDATALAARVAPCILDPDFAHEGAARAILRAAILRWHDSGTGALQSESIGAYQYAVDTRQQRRGLFWPSEIEQLQALCQSESARAFAVDTVPDGVIVHADMCALRFGATYCSCGAILTGAWPLYEGG